MSKHQTFWITQKLKWTAASLVVALCLVVQLALAQVDQLRAELEALGALPPPGKAVATVNGQPIDSGEVVDILKATLAGKSMTREAIAKAQAQTLEQVITRRLITAKIVAEGFAPTQQQTDDAIKDLEERLEAQKVTLQQFLAQRHMTEQQLQAQLLWELGWQNYLKAKLTDPELEKYFNEHRREFDGTELRVSHVLLRPPTIATPPVQQAMVEKANQIRSDIEANKISFADAAKQYSAGPSRTAGGDLGFIARRGVMNEQFSSAAFALEQNQVSEPITTPFGIHLIRWTEARPGSGAWQDSRQQVLAAAGGEQFKKLGEELRPMAKVEYSDAMPHFKPGTEELEGAGVPAAATATPAQTDPASTPPAAAPTPDAAVPSLDPPKDAPAAPTSPTQSPFEPPALNPPTP